MRFHTKLFKSKVITSVFVIVWLLILLLITINHTLSCVDTNKKIKKSCLGKNDKNYLISAYKILVSQNSRR